MKDLMKGMMILMLLIGVPVGIAIVGATIERQNALRIWNGGKHKDCTGNWVLFSASHQRNHGTIYYYKCSKCEKVFETCCNIK